MGVIIRQSIKGTIVTYIGTAIGFLTTFFVLTRFLTAEEIGLTRMLVEVATILAGLSQLGTNSSIIRFYPYFKNENAKDHGFFFWTIVIPFFGFLIFGTLYIIFKQPISHFFAEKSHLFVDYYFYALPLAFFFLYMAVFEVNANVLMRITVPKLTREVIVRILTLVSYLLYAFHWLNLTQFVIAFCSVYVVATIINLVYLLTLKRISFKPDFKYISSALKKDYLLYTLFMVAYALTGVITPSVNTFFLSALKGLNDAGVYSIAIFIATMVEMPYRSLGAISQPEISQTIKDHDLARTNRLIKDVTLHQLLAGSFILFLIWINIDLFFRLLPNGQIYAAAKYVVLILGISRLSNSTFSIVNTVLSYTKYYYFTLLYTIIITSSAIFLNLKLIPVWGYNGAAIASLCSFLIGYSVMIFISNIKTKTNPFSINQLKIIAVFLLLFTINALIYKFISPNFINLFHKEIVGQIVEGILRTGVFAILGIWIIYRWNISEQVNSLIRKYLKKILQKI